MVVAGEGVADGLNGIRASPEAVCPALRVVFSAYAVSVKQGRQGVVVIAWEATVVCIGFVPGGGDIRNYGTLGGASVTFAGGEELCREPLIAGSGRFGYRVVAGGWVSEIGGR